MIVLARHLPFWLAAAAAAAAGALSLRLPVLYVTVISANAFFLAYLVLAFAGLPRLTSSYLRRHAASGDVPVLIIFIVTLAAISVAMIALFLVLNAEARPDPILITLSLLSVPLGWMTIHMMAAIHYAHLYWQPDRGQEEAGGLDFPGTKEPRGMDFVYFSFVIGMTGQTSDVQIVSHAMRKVNIVHAIASFFFNTVLVAAAVNAAVTLGN